MIPNKCSFVARDKIVAAFCDATFVVECGIGSGTMHTVNAAFDYGKTVFSYLPENKSGESFEGNELILKNKNAVKVEDINVFLENLENLKDKPKERTTLDSFF